MSYFWVSVAYSVVNPLLALLILVRSRRNVLSQFYAFCVTSLTALGVFGYFCTRPDPPLPQGVLMAACAFLYSVFPFFFLHFMLIFVRRYEILRSRKTLLAVYFAGLFSYVMVLLGMVPIPFSPETGVSVTGYIYYLTWMSILFSIGVALLYSLVGGFGEHGMKSNLLFLAFVLLMLLLPTPFTLSLFSIMAEDSAVWFFLTSTAALTVLVYIVFRHRITMNTPYQAMKAALAAMNDILFKTNGEFSIELAQGGVVPILGYREGELQGLSLLSFLRNPEPLARFRADVLADRFRECAFETEILCKNGAVLPMEFSFTPVFVNEEATGFVGVGRDIAARRHAERVRACLYAIAGASETEPTLSAFLAELPDILRRVLPADTVHVALHDAATGRITHPCFRDDRGMGPRPRRGHTPHPRRDPRRPAAHPPRGGRTVPDGTRLLDGSPAHRRRRRHRRPGRRNVLVHLSVRGPPARSPPPHLGAGGPVAGQEALRRGPPPLRGIVPPLLRARPHGGLHRHAGWADPGLQPHLRGGLRVRLPRGGLRLAAGPPLPRARTPGGDVRRAPDAREAHIP